MLPLPTLPTGRCESCMTTQSAERNRFVAFAFAWPDLLFELDDAGRIVHATGAFEAIIGLPAGRILGSPFTDLAVPGQRALRALVSAAARRERIDGKYGDRIRYDRRRGKSGLRPAAAAPITAATVPGVARVVKGSVNRR